MPVLANVLLSARDKRLSITATDLEVELVAAHGSRPSSRPAISRSRAGSSSTSCAPCPRRPVVTLSRDGEQVVDQGGRSRFTLSTSARGGFSGRSRRSTRSTAVQMSRKEIAAGCIEKTHFSMAQQDVRYYLNGMLLEI